MNGTNDATGRSRKGSGEIMAMPRFAVALDRTLSDGGDAAAQVLQRLCRRLPPSARRECRDAMIIRIAAWLFVADPLATPNRVVDIITAAAKSLQCGRRLSSRLPFHRLDERQIARLECEIHMLLSWDTVPPAKRQLFKIVTGRM